MNPEQWQQVKEVFHAATELAVEARPAFLRKRCDGNEEMLHELQSLLESHDEAENFIEQPALASASEILSSNGSDFWTGRQIGQYRVLREIGRGGMGLVLLATRADEQFEKRVAIKLLRRGMDTEDLLRRFRTERQILASLEHPHIARLLDGGMTEDGLPYVVLEYIEGEPLDKYCDEHKLTANERLQLFRKVCAAVQYAHQNLIVHRDLKPSNILVTSTGEPKLLDFGIAKLLAPESAPPAIAQTATLARVMTPEYASPEQVRGQHITTASDIYSLGVILYELLTGTRPYKLKDTSPEEMLSIICNSEPTRPSKMFGDERLTTGHGQKTRPQAVACNPKLLRGDLDNIVLMALKKEPSRRYKSVEQFSADIERHLTGKPIAARKDTFTYRASKFIGRNKVGVAATTLVLLAILGGLIVSIWQFHVAARERMRAERERVKAEAVSNFLQTMLGASDPMSQTRERKNDATLKDVLDEASQRLAREDLSTQPEVKAALQRIIGVSYLGQGQYDLAEQNLTSALEAQKKIYGEGDLETLKTLIILGELWVIKGDYAKADQFYRQNLPAFRAAQQRGTIGADFLMVALYNFALARRAQGDSKEAEMLLREELALNTQTPPDEKLGMSVVESVLALTLADQGEFDEAEQMIRAQLASIRRQPGDDASGAALATALNILGGMLVEKGEYAEAEENLREAETIYRKLYNHTFMPLGDNLRIQAQTLYLENKYEEAEAKIKEALEIYRTSAGPGYINYPTALTIQGLIYSQTNRTAEAEKLLREAVQIRSEYMPEAHFLRAVANGVLGEFLTTQKRFAEAEPLLLYSYESLKNSQIMDSPRIRAALQRLITLYENWGKLNAANKYRNALTQIK